jgi:hypothetical protein
MKWTSANQTRALQLASETKTWVILPRPSKIVALVPVVVRATAAQLGAASALALIAAALYYPISKEIPLVVAFQRPSILNSRLIFDKILTAVWELHPPVQTTTVLAALIIMTTHTQRIVLFPIMPLDQWAIGLVWIGELCKDYHPRSAKATAAQVQVLDMGGVDIALATREASAR